MGYFLDKAKSTIQDRDSETMPTGIECERSERSEKRPLPMATSTSTRNYRLKYSESHADDQELMDTGRRPVEVWPAA